MASVVPVKEKKLMDVKLGELPSWLLRRDFTPNGIAGAFQRGYNWYYKYINVKKGSIAGINVVLAAYVLFNYCHSYKHLNTSGDASTTEGPVRRAACTPDCAHLAVKNSTMAESFHILTKN